MLAAVYTKYGPPEVVQVTERPKPVAKENQVLIRVYATTVNRTDCGFRSAEYFIVRFFAGLLAPRNQVLGNEFAGEIVSTGPAVTQFTAGDRVFGYNDKTFGAHAQYIVVTENDPLTTIPAKLSYQEAAAITEGAHYALCNIRAAKIKAGQNILVNGATGAIGSAAVQLLKHFGTNITAVCNTKNTDLVKSLGADRVIDYSKEDFTAINDSFDVVFDAVGKSSFKKCKPLLRKKGIYMSTELGYMSQNPLLALTTPLFGGKKVLFPLPSINRKDVEFLKQLVESGEFKPVIDRSYPLEQIVAAHRYVDSGQKTGNVIITIPQP